MRSMKRREGKAKEAPPPADLLVCFPARAHLTLMPKPVCSPARPSAADSKRRRHHLLKKSTTTSGLAPTLASPLLLAKTKPLGGAGEMTSEPTSPKVTCAGQIKIRPKSSRSTKRWQSVMEEIERIHNKRKLRNRPSWAGSLGLKTEPLHFLSCLRNIRFDFRCFRGFSASDVTTEDEYDDEEEDDDDEEESNKASGTMFSKWFMVLQEEDRDGEFGKQLKAEKSKPSDDDEASSAPPPPNALLLMRCRSAPANSWLDQEIPKQEEEKEEEEQEDEEEKTKISLKVLMEEEKEVIKKKESLVVMNMNYDADFYKLSSDIAKETWVVSGSSRDDDPLVRCRSWKRW